MEGSISAPEMLTMLHQDDTHQKPKQKKQKILGRAGQALGTAACTALTGCAAPQVRPPPEPAPCPAGALEAMADKLGVDVGKTASAYFQTEESAHDIPVHAGPTSVELGPLSMVESGRGIILSGTLFIGKKRVYGRFTEARDPYADGQPFPVCFEMWDSYKGGMGVVYRGDGSSDSTLIDSTVDVIAVPSFK